MNSLQSQSLALLLMTGSAAGMPRLFDESTICAHHGVGDTIDAGPLCEKPARKYERIFPVQPGFQWDDAGGYCGSWSVQRASLSVGAWVSQQQVRDHTSPGGGHDNEILSTNMDEALRRLKLTSERFDFEDEPLPQQKAYFQWLKKHLAAGHVVPWMIMWNTQRYPIYNLTPPAGMYGHVEPVIGIQSNHPLNDTNVYDDDVVVHYTDGGTSTVYRVISTLPGSWDGVGSRARCHGGYSYCIGPYAFGWAVTGVADESTKHGVPAYLHVEPWKQEPDTRSGATAIPLRGTLTVSGLTPNTSYEIYRWDTVKDAFTYSDSFKKTTFEAMHDTFVYSDSESFESNGTTYYRCVAQKAV